MSTSTNNTYFTAPSSLPTSCTLEICPCSSSVSQIRLDLNTFTLGRLSLFSLFLVIQFCCHIYFLKLHGLFLNRNNDKNRFPFLNRVKCKLYTELCTLCVYESAPNFGLQMKNTSDPYTIDTGENQILKMY